MKQPIKQGYLIPNIITTQDNKCDKNDTKPSFSTQKKWRVLITNFLIQLNMPLKYMIYYYFYLYLPGKA